MTTTYTFDKIRCVTYKDEFSIGNNSYNDLLVSIKEKVVGCGSAVFGASKSGDVVIICANNGKDKYFTIGILNEKLNECDLWHQQGGRKWNYNFTYTEIYPLTKRDDNIDKLCYSLCVDFNIAIKKVDNKIINRYYDMFNSRLCGIKYKPIIIELIELRKKYIDVI